MATNRKTLDTTAGIALILPGIALTLLGPNFDGFVKGMCQGAGIMLILIGVFLLSVRNRRPQDPDDSMWLPSRDETGHPDRDGR